MPAANLRGFEAYVGELSEDDVEANAALLLAVARELLLASGGGSTTPLPPFQLASRHKVMKLGPDESSAHRRIEGKASDGARYAARILSGEQAAAMYSTRPTAVLSRLWRVGL